MANNIPLTIQCGIASNFGSVIVAGSNNMSLQYNLSNLYWVVVLDRTDLSVKLNTTFSTNSAVPSALQAYAGNSQYLMILATQNLSSTNLPTGAFYTFLTSEGAGTELNKLEQVFAALNCGTWGTMGYTLVTVLDGSTSYEYSNVTDSAMVDTLQLVPIQIGKQTLYTPVQL